MLILISRKINKKLIQKLAKEKERELQCYTTKEKTLFNVKDRNWGLEKTKQIDIYKIKCQIWKILLNQ